MKLNSILIDGYFLICESYGLNVDYKSIVYFPSEELLKDYINNEYKSTDLEMVCDCSVEELMSGITGSASSRQGMGYSTSKILLIHGSNFNELFDFLDSLLLSDRKNNRFYLSEYLKKAKTEQEVEKVINIFNGNRENYW